MELIDTIEGMTSADYKERFKAEYKQLAIRTSRLDDTITKVKDNKINFELKSKVEQLGLQLYYMRGYMEVLEDRAKTEGINLD